MHSTPAMARSEPIDPGRRTARALERALAEIVVFRTHVLQARWNTRGKSFFAVRGRFAVLDDTVSEWADRLAERISVLGVAVKATARHAVGLAETVDYPCELKHGADHASLLAHGLGCVEHALVASCEAAREGGDEITAMVCMRVRASLESERWQLRALQPLPLPAAPPADSAAANSEDHDEVEEASMESFPASDAPATRHHTS